MVIKASDHDTAPERPAGVPCNLLLLLLALAVTLLLLEVVLRVLGVLEPVLYRPDPVLGYEPQPNQSATRLGVPIYIGDIGLRDNENDSTLLKSKTRLLVIGNSVTYGGSRIRQPDLFTEVMERDLRSRRGDIKVLNAGVNGYSVSQMLARAPDRPRRSWTSPSSRSAT